MNIPMSLTVLRIVLIPVLVFCFFKHSMPLHILTLFVFLVAAFTDWLDGHLARSLSQSSKLGAFLDPVADKLLVATCLILIVSEKHTAWIVIPTLIIIFREIYISALREWVAKSGVSATVDVIFAAKVKTGLQMTAIGFLFGARFMDGLVIPLPVFMLIGIVLLLAATVVTLWTMHLYTHAAWLSFKNHTEA